MVKILYAELGYIYMPEPNSGVKGRDRVGEEVE